jgi:hypothetical protein
LMLNQFHIARWTFCAAFSAEGTLAGACEP